jgi:isoquinoline 1-oxidoreductase beta subunit
LKIIEVPAEGGKMTQIVPGYPPDTRRLRGVAERAAQVSGWDEKVKQYKNMKGRGLGIAVHRSFLSYVAIVADVSLNDQNEVTINDIYGVVDCGLAVNRDRVMAQMEGGIIYGLSYALLGEITVKNGAVVQNNFDDYPILRIHQTPRIHSFIQDPPAEVVKEYGGSVPPTGVGEPPTPAVAPAVANAIFAAGGPRIREIPFKKQVKVL